MYDTGKNKTTAILRYDSGVFRTLSNTYDGAFAKKSNYKCLAGPHIHLCDLK